ncbi:MAG TPA: glycosyltransferase family 4 protein [Acidimicrobiales bacterium]
MPVLAAFVLALMSMPIVLAVLHRRGLVDRPNERSSHAVPTPRGGGVAVALGASAGAFLSTAITGSARAALVGGALALGGVGLADDVRSLAAYTRLGLQFAISGAALAGLLVGLSGSPLWQVVFVAGCVVWCVAYVNAFNFMDGINGISVAQATIAGVAWWVLGTAQDADAFATAGALIAAAALGFAPFNFPNARAFIGDVGSYFVGFWLAGTAILGLRAGIAPEAVLAPLSPYLADTASTLIRRLRQGATLHEAHRDHAYQRLTVRGWSHARTTTFVGAVIAIAAGLGGIAATASLPARGAADAALLLLLAGYVVSPEVVPPRADAEGNVV